MICLDEMGPQASKSYPGRRLVRPAGPGAERARQEIDYGRRGTAGYVFGALQPTSGAAFTLAYERRTTANRVDFLGADRGLDRSGGRAGLRRARNLNIHSAPTCCCSPAAPALGFVFQPEYAAYLNLIEPWWKVLRSLALKGRLRGLGRDRAGRRAGHGLLERPQARWGPARRRDPLHLGMPLTRLR